jgi:hypothetical protein
MGHFLAALLGKLFADEVRAWLPWLAESLTKAAIRHLPEDHRVRYDEEWHGHLDEVPGAVAKLWVACGFLYAAGQASSRRKLETFVLAFGFATFLFVLSSIFVAVAALAALNSRRCYKVPLIVIDNAGAFRLTLTRLSFELALHYSLRPRLSLEELNSIAYHYSFRQSSRLVDVENFLTRIVGGYPSLSFGIERKLTISQWLKWNFDEFRATWDRRADRGA